MQQFKRLGIVLIILIFTAIIPYNLAVYFTNNTISSKNYFLNYLGLSIFGCIIIFAFIAIVAILIGIISSIINYIKTGN